MNGAAGLPFPITICCQEAAAPIIHSQYCRRANAHMELRSVRSSAASRSSGSNPLFTRNVRAASEASAIAGMSRRAVPRKAGCNGAVPAPSMMRCNRQPASNPADLMNLPHITYYAQMSAISKANEDLFSAESANAENHTLPSQASAIVIADANRWIRRELVLNIFPLLQGQASREARSPSEVLERISNATCKVLIIDPCMPTVGQSDGIPLLRRICCLRRDLRILVLTRQPQQLLRDSAFPRQIGHVHGKNINATWLCRFVDQALAQAEAA